MTIEQMLNLIVAELKGQITIDDAYIMWMDIESMVINLVREMQTDAYSSIHSSVSGTSYDQDNKYVEFTMPDSNEIHKLEITKMNGYTQDETIKPKVIDDLQNLMTYPYFGVYLEQSGTTLKVYTNYSVSSADWTINAYYIKEFTKTGTVDEILKDLYRNYVKSKFGDQIALVNYSRARNNLVFKLTNQGIGLV